MLIKIILFSPNGYVGSYIKQRLINEKGIQLYEITRKGVIGEEQKAYDILIYTASITSNRCEAASKYVQDNVMSALAMIDFCKKHFVKRIIYLSSDEIYGNLNVDIVTEQAVMVNPNFYAVTKYLAEKIIIESGLSYYILRLPGIVGNIWRKNFICELMDKMKSNKSIELYNAERNFNNILDINDLVNFITLLCKERNVGTNEVLLLGNTECIRLRSLVLYIKELYQSKSVINYIEADDKRCFVLDVSKAIKHGYSSKKIRTIIDELYQIQER